MALRAAKVPSTPFQRVIRWDAVFRGHHGSFLEANMLFQPQCRRQTFSPDIIRSLSRFRSICQASAISGSSCSTWTPLVEAVRGSMLRPNYAAWEHTCERPLLVHFELRFHGFICGSPSSHSPSLFFIDILYSCFRSLPTESAIFSGVTFTDAVFLLFNVALLSS